MGILLCAGLAGLARSAAGTCGKLGLRFFGCRRDHGVPIKQAAATIAGKELAFAELIPDLGANPHAAAKALLVIGAGNAGAARSHNAFEAAEPVGIDSRPNCIACGTEGGNLNSKLLLAHGYTSADTFEFGGKLLYLCAGLGQFGFLRLRALEAGVFFALQPLGLGGFELNLVFDRCRLLGSSDGIVLAAEFSCLLAVRSGLALEAGAQSLFAAERGGNLGGVALGGSEPGLCLSDLSRQRLQLLVEPGAVEIEGLESYKVLNNGFHQ